MVKTNQRVRKAQFLWIDDEVELLKPYILFLEEKGYRLDCVNNGTDAIGMCRSKRYDMVFLDENMPGLSGLDTLTQLHELRPEMPVVMVTKSEDEGIMNGAIGRKIADYLIKPVHPHQVLMSIKKILDKKVLEEEATVENYRNAYRRINEEIGDARSLDAWKEIYRTLVRWELELGRIDHPMAELLQAQKAEANRLFARFVQRYYADWILRSESCPVMSPDLLRHYLFPMLDGGEKAFLIVIDNFRFDQWLAVKDIVCEEHLCDEAIYLSILPTVTQYARNALFSGLMPLRLAEAFPDLWADESEEESKNLHEELLLAKLLERTGKKRKFRFHKINNGMEGEKLLSGFSELAQYDLVVLVFNFIDIMSHARTESKMIRELSADDAAYRSLTRSWFLHAPLWPLIRRAAAAGYRVMLTTDHGSIRVRNGLMIMGDRQTNVTLRYKLGKNLGYDPKAVCDTVHPESFGLPSPQMSTRYIFARNDDFFLYPNQYNYYASLYRDTFQHGGISMEEMLIPFITLTTK